MSEETKTPKKKMESHENKTQPMVTNMARSRRRLRDSLMRNKMFLKGLVFTAARFISMLCAPSIRRWYVDG